MFLPALLANLHTTRFGFLSVIGGDMRASSNRREKIRDSRRTRGRNDHCRISAENTAKITRGLGL
jgi:hypothetical protein